MTTKRVAIKEVARSAGVSTQTVSRVINNRPEVSSQTREHVLQVIDRIGYRPSRAAQALRGSGCTLGVVGYGLEYYGPSRILIGVERQARQAGYGVVLELTPDPVQFDVDAIIDKMLSNHVDGIVWCIPDIDDNMTRISAYARTADIPIIFTNTLPNPSYAVVEVDNCAGGTIAVQHLVDQGHRTVGLIAGPRSYQAARDRQKGWAHVLQAHGLEHGDDLVAEGDWTTQGGAEAFSALIERRPDITALFASNDQMALGTFWVARKLGLRIPEDLAVVGYDNIPEAEYLQPALSFIHQDVVERGACAVNELIKMIKMQQQTGSFKTQPKELVADKAYDSAAFRRQLRRRGIKPTIPTFERCKRKKPKRSHPLRVGAAYRQR